MNRARYEPYEGHSSFYSMCRFFPEGHNIEDAHRPVNFVDEWPKLQNYETVNLSLRSLCYFLMIYLYCEATKYKSIFRTYDGTIQIHL